MNDQRFRLVLDVKVRSSGRVDAKDVEYAVHQALANELALVRGFPIAGPVRCKATVMEVSEDRKGTKYHCLACGISCERGTTCTLPAGTEFCSHEWELIEEESELDESP